MSESFVTEGTPADWKPPPYLLEDYKRIRNENVEIKSSRNIEQQRARKIIISLSLIIIVSASVLITIFLINGKSVIESMALGGQSTRDKLNYLEELHSDSRELHVQLRELVDRTNNGIEELKWRVDRNEHAIQFHSDKIDKDIWDFHEDFKFEGIHLCNYLYDYIRYDLTDFEQWTSNSYIFASVPEQFKNSPCGRRKPYNGTEDWSMDNFVYRPVVYELEPIPEFPRPNSTAPTMPTITTGTSAALITAYDCASLIFLSYSILYFF